MIVRYVRIPFGAGISIADMRDWHVQRLQVKLQYWQYKDLPFAHKLTVLCRILQASHVYYVSYWLPNCTQFAEIGENLEVLFWAKYGGERGLLMVPWHVCIITKNEGRLSLIDVTSQGIVLMAKWVVKGLNANAPWKVLLRHRILQAQPNVKVRGSFGLCDIITSPNMFKFEVPLFRKSFGKHGEWLPSTYVELLGTWLTIPFRVGN